MAVIVFCTPAQLEGAANDSTGAAGTVLIGGILKKAVWLRLLQPMAVTPIVQFKPVLGPVTSNLKVASLELIKVSIISKPVQLVPAKNADAPVAPLGSSTLMEAVSPTQSLEGNTTFDI